MTKKMIRKPWSLAVMFLIVFSFENIQSQTYFPFPDSSAVWRTDWGDIDCFLSGHPISQYQYILEGDTLINGTHYTKVIRTGFISPFCPPNTPFNPSIGYQGAYRQEIVSKQVFLVLPDSTEEILFYNFSLETGDTLKGYFSLTAISPCTFPLIDFTDSIMINNSMRKRLHITGDNTCTSYFIEGIGSTHGLFENLQSFEGGGELVCFLQNDSVIYKSNPSVECQLITSVFTYDDKPNIKLYPNPVNTFLNVEGIPGESHLDYIIYNIFGSLVKTGSSPTNQIPITGIGNGMFFLKLSFNGATNLSFKFISKQY